MKNQAIQYKDYLPQLNLTDEYLEITSSARGFLKCSDSASIIKAFITKGAYRRCHVSLGETLRSLRGIFSGLDLEYSKITSNRVPFDVFGVDQKLYCDRYRTGTGGTFIVISLESESG